MTELMNLLVLVFVSGMFTLLMLTIAESIVESLSERYLADGEEKE
jgi:hypothetical protein